jgi:hypothetical protein
MIGILIIMYVFLNYYIEMEREEMFKFMIVLSFVNVTPVLIYMLYTMIYGGLDFVILMLMTAI